MMLSMELQLVMLYRLMLLDVLLVVLPMVVLLLLDKTLRNQRKVKFRFPGNISDENFGQNFIF